MLNNVINVVADHFRVGLAEGQHSEVMVASGNYTTFVDYKKAAYVVRYLIIENNKFLKVEHGVLNEE